MRQFKCTHFPRVRKEKSDEQETVSKSLCAVQHGKHFSIEVSRTSSEESFRGPLWAVLRTVKDMREG